MTILEKPVYSKVCVRWVPRMLTAAQTQTHTHTQTTNKEATATDITGQQIFAEFMHLT